MVLVDDHSPEFTAIRDAANRLGADGGAAAAVLERIDAEFPPAGLETAVEESDDPEISWPTRQDALAWLLAAVCSSEHSQNVTRLLESADLSSDLHRLAVAEFFLSGDAPLLLKTELGSRLRGMARFLATSRASLDRMRVSVEGDQVSISLPPTYQPFSWGWQRVSGSSLPKRTSHFARVLRRAEPASYRIPFLDHDDPMKAGWLGPWGLQLIGRPAAYRRIPWTAIHRSRLRTEGPEDDDGVDEEIGYAPLGTPGGRVREWLAHDDRLFSLRSNVLLELASGVEAGSKDEAVLSSVVRCLDPLTEREAVRWVRQLEVAIVFERNMPIAFREIELQGAPLAALLELVGHVQLELDLGIYDHAARILHDGGPLGRPGNDWRRISPFVLFSSGVGLPLRAAVDAYISAEPDLEAAWNRFRHRLVRTIDHDLYRSVAPPQKRIRGRFVEEFKRRIDLEAERIVLELESARRRATPPYLFVRAGTQWLVHFNGDIGWIEHCDGMLYIQILIAEGRPLTGTELRARIGKAVAISAEPSEAEPPETDEDFEDGFGLAPPQTQPPARCQREPSD